MQKEKAKTVAEKRIAKELLKQAKINAEVAGELLKVVKAGEKVSREEADACAAIAKAVHEATEALAAGDTGKAGDVLDRIAELEGTLPTVANARSEMQRAGADTAGKNQSFTADDMNKKGKPAEPGSSLPTAGNAGAEMQGADGAGKPPVTPPAVTPRNIAYCQNNNIITPEGRIVPCGEKICKEVTGGAGCWPVVPAKPVCSEKKKEECASTPSPDTPCLMCRQVITKTCEYPDGTKKTTTKVTEWYCK